VRVPQFGIGPSSFARPRGRCQPRPACTCTKTLRDRHLCGQGEEPPARVRSYFLDERLADVKTGTLIPSSRHRFHHVDNEKEALALENNLINRYKPRYNILLRDDKTYPYIKLTAERYPRVYVRGAEKGRFDVLGHISPAIWPIGWCTLSTAIQGSFLQWILPAHAPCLEYHIHRCHGPCVEARSATSSTPGRSDVRLFLEGRHKDSKG
jgi:excinuclease ABC subunit C